MRILFTCLFLVISFGCAEPGPVHMTETECRINSDCESGSYCDPFLQLCGWDCRDDSECELGMYCDAANGRCLREEAPPIESPVLEIMAGDLADTVVMGGTSDTELLRFDVVNHGDRDATLRLLPVGFAHVGGAPAEVGSFTDVKFTDRAGLYTLMGPQDLRPEVGANIYFDDEIPLPAGETTTLVLRADLGGSGRYRVTVGALVALLEDVVYADTLERIPSEHIRGNRILGRVIDVLPRESVGSGHVALVMSFVREQGILHPSEGRWERLGTIVMDSYGGSSRFHGTGVLGGNIGFLSSITLAQDGRIVGEISTPTGACSCGLLSLLSAVTIPDGERVELEVWGMVAADAGPGELTFGLDASMVRAEPASGRYLSAIITGEESRFRVWETRPVVTRQSLSTTTLANGIDQDLFRFQVSSAVAGHALNIGSLTVRFGGGSGGAVSNLHVRVGSTDLSRSLYRLVRTATGEEIGPTDTVNAFSEQVTIVFTESPGVLISGSGHVITIVGTPSGFSPGDELRVMFGDRIFSSLGEMSGNLTSRGSLTRVAGDEIGAIDPIVWTDNSVGGVYTGAWEIEDLTQVEILTR